MRYLSDVPFSELAVGKRVLSATGHEGKITELIPREKATRQEDNEIVIVWEAGNSSWFWHFWGDKVLYLEDSYVLQDSLLKDLPVKEEALKKKKL